MALILLLPVTMSFAGGDQEKGQTGQENAAEAGKDLRVAFAWPTYIDPAVGSDFSSSSAFVNLYDTLVYPTPDGGVKANVAESWGDIRGRAYMDLQPQG